MAKTQKNKATSYHLGQLKAKLAKLKRELLTPSSSGGGGGAGFDVARTGVASIGFIGFPSVGKSTLMSRLTGQHSEAAAYEFTTLTSVPGQVIYNGAYICVVFCSYLSSFIGLGDATTREQAQKREREEEGTIGTHSILTCLSHLQAPLCRLSISPVLSREPRTAADEVARSSPSPRRATSSSSCSTSTSR